MEALLDRTIHETRALTFELTPPMLYELGLVPALQWLVERYDKQGRMRARLHLPQNGHAQPADPPPQIAALLFTAVRELLHNVVKHAAATVIDVTVSDQKGRLCVAVDDNGCGFPRDHDLKNSGSPSDEGADEVLAEKNVEDETGGFGLFSIRTRLLYVGGEMRIISAKGKGTHVTLVAPPSDPSGNREGEAS
jgi:signal transduction histidine kinase